MSQRIEDYALIGNTFTAALVGRDGSIDWLCVPRFDSPACFAALLGQPQNGRFLIAPDQPVHAVRRRYRPGTLVLETEFDCDGGSVTVIDFMPRIDSEEDEDLVRIVVGRRGTVKLRLELLIRFDYGRVVPWVRRRPYGLSAIAGPDAVQLRTPVELVNQDFTTTASFTVAAGQAVPFSVNWHPSHRPEPPGRDPHRQLADTEAWWCEWSRRYRGQGGPWTELERRSLITLKALTYSPTGGIVAAPTTSLPERLGGVRNWDYRYCWLRDATFTLYALLSAGYTEEAVAWREWLLRSVAGQPQELQIMYGIAGERRLVELELPWLAGYAGSAPVRIGNAAHHQVQLDVYGEIMDSFHVARRFNLTPSDDTWRVQRVLLDFLEGNWEEADEGIWEVRGPRRMFTHSKVMAWVAADRAVKAVERFGFDGPVERWRCLRDTIRHDVCRHGFNAERNAFVQSYGGDALDAALLMLPLVGFLPATDPRIVGTVQAIERELTFDGLVLRYAADPDVDGLPAGEGAFLACSFWLADNLIMMGRQADGRALFERLVALCNDVGLLAEEYDPRARRQLGNFPQAFSHVALFNTAQNLALIHGPADRRAE